MKLLCSASAPLKVIVSGEHGVVHGTPAVTLTLEPFNEVDLFEEEGEPGLVIRGRAGEVAIDSSGNVVDLGGKERFSPLVALVKHLVARHGFRPRRRLVAIVKAARAPKGMGMGSSIAACLASVLFHAMGREPRRGAAPEEDELWMAVQAADEVSHGGRPSGIDAMSVSYGPTRLVRVAEEGKVAWQFSPSNAVLPEGCKLIVIDTFKGGRSGTGEMIRTFAKANNLLNSQGGIKTLLELTDADRKGLGEFVSVFGEVSSHLHAKGDAKKLGAALKKNHLLLSKSGVSTAEIEEVIAIAEANGGHGAKLTGAGGKGGAVIVVAPDSAVARVEKALLTKGYKTFVAAAVPRGVAVEKKAEPSERHVSG